MPNFKDIRAVIGGGKRDGQIIDSISVVIAPKAHESQKSSMAQKKQAIIDKLKKGRDKREKD